MKYKYKINIHKFLINSITDNLLIITGYQSEFSLAHESDPDK